MYPVLGPDLPVGYAYVASLPRILIVIASAFNLKWHHGTQLYISPWAVERTSESASDLKDLESWQVLSGNEERERQKMDFFERRQEQQRMNPGKVCQ